jgi:naphthoate synthase
VLGEKRAREIWFFCRQYDAETALAWGLVNKIVPAEDLLAEAKRWGRETAALSPTAIKFLKASFNADSDQIVGTGKLAFAGLEAFADSAEAHEGHESFVEKRRADFSRFR